MLKDKLIRKLDEEKLERTQKKSGQTQGAALGQAMDAYLAQVQHDLAMPSKGPGILLQAARNRTVRPRALTQDVLDDIKGQR